MPLPEGFRQAKIRVESGMLMFFKLASRSRRTILGHASLCALLISLVAVPAAAQSLFETLFGPSKPSHAYPHTLDLRRGG